MSSYFTAAQIEQLLRPINPVRVKDRKGMAYVAAHDIKAHLTRIFGFGRWSSELLELHLVCDHETVTNAAKERAAKEGKVAENDAWYVVYRAIVKLTVCAPDGTPVAVYTEAHAGDSTHPVRGEAHGNAITNAESYALKRCAISLGDQFGLSLYNKGQRTAIVGGSKFMPNAQRVDPNSTPDVDASTPQVHDEVEESPAEQPPQRPIETNKPKPRSDVKAQDLADQALAVGGSPKDRLTALTKLQLASITSGTKDEPVNGPVGQMTLGQLIAECIAGSRLGRAS
jgi:recombination DNA repair RAD52 pathway protein